MYRRYVDGGDLLVLGGSGEREDEGEDKGVGRGGKKEVMV